MFSQPCKSNLAFLKAFGSKKYRLLLLFLLIIKNVLIKVTLIHTKVLQGHFIQLTRERCRGAELEAA